MWALFLCFFGFGVGWPIVGWRCGLSSREGGWAVITGSGYR